LFGFGGALMSKAKILVVEDDEDIGELLKYNLEKEGYQVIQAMTGETGIKQAAKKCPDLILLDIMLPGIDGLGVCKTLKRESKTELIPIIILTAKGEESDIVAGLELGAEDYITKPFSPKVVIARIRTVLRRQHQEIKTLNKSSIKIHGLSLDIGRHKVNFKGKTLDLTLTEFKLLEFMSSRPGWVFTRYQLVDGIRGDDYPVTERSIDVQIVGLRKKLKEAGQYIETVRGIGYRFKE